MWAALFYILAIAAPFLLPNIFFANEEEADARGISNCESVYYGTGGVEDEDEDEDEDGDEDGDGDEDEDGDGDEDEDGDGDEDEDEDEGQRDDGQREDVSDSNDSSETRCDVGNSVNASTQTCVEDTKPADSDVVIDEDDVEYIDHQSVAAAAAEMEGSESTTQVSPEIGTASASATGEGAESATAAVDAAPTDVNSID